MAAVDFHLAPDVVLHVRRLRGTMLAVVPGTPASFDDKRSFVIRVGTADAGITTGDLGRLLNGYVFAYDGAPLSDLRVGTEGERVRLRGILHKGADLPFDIVASLSVTPAGLLRLHPLHVRVARVPVGPLLELAGIPLDRLLDLRGSRGAAVRGDDVLLDPDSMLPPPRIGGRVVAARVVGDEIRLTFDDGSATPAAEAPGAASNYLRFAGGTVRFGKLFMVHTDLTIVDEAPDDPLDFSLDEYARQLVAGFVRNTPAGGLVVHVPDLRTLGRAPSSSTP